MKKTILILSVTTGILGAALSSGFAADGVRSATKCWKDTTIQQTCCVDDNAKVTCS